MIKTSSQGIALIQQRNPLHQQAWLNPTTQLWTIGYGHTTGVCQGDSVTESQATEYLLDNLRLPEKAVNQQMQLIQLSTLTRHTFVISSSSAQTKREYTKIVPDYSWIRDRTLVQQRFDIMVAYCFEVGISAFKSSQLLATLVGGASATILNSLLADMGLPLFVEV